MFGIMCDNVKVIVEGDEGFIGMLWLSVLFLVDFFFKFLIKVI